VLQEFFIDLIFGPLEAQSPSDGPQKALNSATDRRDRGVVDDLEKYETRLYRDSR
jgi:hypothetical protein